MKLQISDPYGKNSESKLCRWKCYILNFLLNEKKIQVNLRRSVPLNLVLLWFWRDWHAAFHKVVWKHPSGEMGNSVVILLQIYEGICLPKIVEIALHLTVIATRGQCNLTKSASRGGGIPRLWDTPGDRKLYHWIPGVGFPIIVP